MPEQYRGRRRNLSDLDANFSDVVRALLHATGRMQDDLGDVLGLSRASVTMKLTGRNAWRLTEAAVVAQWFGLKVDEMIRPTGRLAELAQLAAEGRLPRRRGSQERDVLDAHLRVALDLALRDAAREHSDSLRAGRGAARSDLDGGDTEDQPGEAHGQVAGLLV